MNERDWVRYLSNCNAISCRWSERMFKLIKLVDIFNVYVQLFELNAQNCLKQEMFVKNWTSSQVRYMSNYTIYYILWGC